MMYVFVCFNVGKSVIKFIGIKSDSTGGRREEAAELSSTVLGIHWVTYALKMMIFLH